MDGVVGGPGGGGGGGEDGRRVSLRGASNTNTGDRPTCGGGGGGSGGVRSLTNEKHALSNNIKSTSMRRNEAGWLSEKC